MLIKKNLFLRITRKIIGYISPKLLASLYYRKTAGRWMSWKNPQDLNEKILWLSLCSDTTEWTDLADKYKVREFVEKKGLGNLLVKLYGVWEHAEDIDYEKLPERFVLKTNHGSGTNIIVRDKSKLDFKKTNEQLDKWLKMRFGWPIESHYLRIKPLIIAEEYLEENVNKQSSSLIDYKLFCLQGNPEGTLVCYDRSSTSVKMEWYDLDWTYHPEWSINSEQYQKGKGIIEKPHNWNQMLEAARLLSEGFPQVRVDFYDVNDKLYFGEMTFTSNQGTMTYLSRELLLELGKKVSLTQ